MKYQLSSAVKHAGHSVQSKNPFDTPVALNASLTHTSSLVNILDFTSS